NFYSAGQRANASRASDPRAGGSLLVRRQLNPLIRHRVLFILLFAVVLCSLVTAQNPPDKPAQGKPQPPAKPAQPPEQDDQTSKIGVYEVRLPVAVREKNKFVSGLSKNNFEVYEDGKRQQIETFIAPSKLPLDIAVLMDTSNSVKLKLPFEKDAAE